MSEPPGDGGKDHRKGSWRAVLIGAFADVALIAVAMLVLLAISAAAFLLVG